MLPALRRTVAHPLHARLTGSPRWRYWRELERTQWLPRQSLLELQWQRLEELLRFVHENNDYYRWLFAEHGIQPREIQAPADLRRIPVLTKAEIRANEFRMISRGFDPASLLEFRTGGSTGKPLRVRITEECSERRNACAWRHDRWTGWDIGDPVGALWGNPPSPKGWKEQLRRHLLAPVIYLDTMELNRATVSRFAAEWRQLRPSLLFGHAHSLFRLAQIVESEKLRAIRPRGILSTSMSLIPYERREIERVFAVPVFDRYGCEEVSLIGSECERRAGMHLNVEHLFVEIVGDAGEPAAPGQAGRVVVTDLQNRAMPFVRYAVEDVAVAEGAACPCGRGLPLLDHVAGRTADFLRKRDGTEVSGISIIENTLTRHPGIAQMQIVQRTLSELSVRLVRDHDYTEETERRLREYFDELFGPDTRIEFVHVDDIAPGPGGKYRFAVCEVDR